MKVQVRTLKGERIALTVVRSSTVEQNAGYSKVGSFLISKRSKSFLEKLGTIVFE